MMRREWTQVRNIMPNLDIKERGDMLSGTEIYGNTKEKKDNESWAIRFEHERPHILIKVVSGDNNFIRIYNKDEIVGKLDKIKLI